mmetsp:Transcript_95592/g.270480  ORF Transcript_95592/g.270480 Transcript_95592/m.270480 type:complete len:203 (+) Transcript_95592:1201-1809(+)
MQVNLRTNLQLQPLPLFLLRGALVPRLCHLLRRVPQPWSATLALLLLRLVTRRAAAPGRAGLAAGSLVQSSAVLPTSTRFSSIVLATLAAAARAFATTAVCASVHRIPTWYEAEPFAFATATAASLPAAARTSASVTPRGPALEAFTPPGEIPGGASSAIPIVARVFLDSRASATAASFPTTAARVVASPPVGILGVPVPIS